MTKRMRMKPHLLEVPVKVGLGLLADLRPQGLRRQARPLHRVWADKIFGAAQKQIQKINLSQGYKQIRRINVTCGREGRLLARLLGLVPAALLVDLVGDGGGGGGAGGEEAVEEVGDGGGEGEHVHSLQVVGEEVLGGADDELGDADDVDVVELGDLGEHLGDLAEVAHVDPPVVDRVGQGLAVHRRRAVVQAVADERRDLHRDQEVGGVLAANIC